MKVVKDCINITRSFCDLTDVWVNTTDMYIPQVVGFREKAQLIICTGSFFLASDSEFVLFTTARQDEALARDGVSREVPCSALYSGGVLRTSSRPTPTPHTPPTRPNHPGTSCLLSWFHA